MGQFYFNYAIYHYNPINRAVHIIFIPQLVFTAFSMMHYTPHIPLKLGSAINIDADFSFYLSVLTCLGYMLVDVRTGICSLIAAFIALGLSTHLYENNDHYFKGYHFQFVLGVHLFAWFVQFYAHYVYEKRSPALFNNGLLTLAAPFFFIFEVLASLFGYKKQELKEWRQVIAREVDHYRKKNKIR